MQAGATTADAAILSATQVAEQLEKAARSARPGDPPADIQDPAAAGIAPDERGVVEQPIVVLIQALRANCKVFISLREDQRAAWSEGDGRGLVGFSLSSAKDPAIYMRTFLLNGREMYLQSYRPCQELRCELYVRTAQGEVRGRVDLPPDTIVTFQTGADRSSVVGLSSFAIEFPQAVGRHG